MDTSFTFFGYTIFKNSTEKEIHKLFQSYETALTVQRQKMCDDITEWGDALIQSIYKHANQQKYRLEQEYKNQTDHLNKTCHRFLEELRIHEQSQNTEQISQLLDRCKTLEFELAALEYNGQSVPFIEVARKERRMTNPEEFYMNEAENEKFNNRATINDSKEGDNNLDTQSAVQWNAAFSRSRRSDTQLSRTSSEDVYHDLASADGGQKFHDTIEDDLLEKCPICFMIFPSTMTGDNRSKHVHEHYQDDE